MKKVLLMVLVWVMVLTFIPLNAVMASAETLSGTTGDCTWTLADGVLTISGNGEMEDYNVEIFEIDAESDSPWYNSDIQKVIISEGVTAIGDGAFTKCNQLSTVEIASTVISIGKGAFANTGLKNINIPKSVRKIDCAAFLLTNSAQEWKEFLENVFYVGDEIDRSKLFINNSDELNISIVSATWKYVDFETLIKVDGENWNYYVNGIKRDYTTLVKYKGKWFYVENGVWPKTANTLVKYKGKWFGVVNGKWNSAVNTLIKHKGKWFYIKNGKWCQDTAIVKYSGKRFYVKKGKVDFEFSGKKKINGKTYKIKNGKVV